MYVCSFFKLLIKNSSLFLPCLPIISRRKQLHADLLARAQAMGCTKRRENIRAYLQSRVITRSFSLSRVQRGRPLCTEQQRWRTPVTLRARVCLATLTLCRFSLASVASARCFFFSAGKNRDERNYWFDGECLLKVFFIVLGRGRKAQSVERIGFLTQRMQLFTYVLIILDYFINQLSQNI